MRRKPLVLLLAVVVAAGALSARLLAQEKKARGTVTSVTASSVAIQVPGGTAMTFAIDGKTSVEARGGSTATREAQAAGRAGVKVGDLIKTGNAVEVTYTEAAGAMKATAIRVVPSAGAAPSASAPAAREPEPNKSAGRVTSVTASSLTVAPATGAAQTFVIDSLTSVVARGAGTAARRAGGTAPITSMIAVGDSVDVSSKKVGDRSVATEVRVTAKAK